MIIYVSLKLSLWSCQYDPELSLSFNFHSRLVWYQDTVPSWLYLGLKALQGLSSQKPLQKKRKAINFYTLIEKPTQLGPCNPADLDLRASVPFGNIWVSSFSLIYNQSISVPTIHDTQPICWISTTIILTHSHCPTEFPSDVNLMQPCRSFELDAIKNGKAADLNSIEGRRQEPLARKWAQIRLRIFIILFILEQSPRTSFSESIRQR